MGTALLSKPCLATNASTALCSTSPSYRRRGYVASPAEMSSTYAAVSPDRASASAAGSADDRSAVAAARSARRRRLSSRLRRALGLSRVAHALSHRLEDFLSEVFVLDAD